MLYYIILTIAAVQNNKIKYYQALIFDIIIIANRIAIKMQMDMESERGSLSEAQINDRKKKQEILYKIVQLVTTFTETTDFSLDNADQQMLLILINMWHQRKIFSHDKRLKLHLQNCELPKQVVTEFFQNYPSIVVYHNGEKIQNNTLIKTQNLVYYEGKQNNMFIYYLKTGAFYHGPVNNEEECLPHGLGAKIQFPKTKDQTKYQGQFVNGKKQGYGVQLRKNTHYQGQWLNDEKNGQGIQFVIKKKKKVQKQQSSVIASQQKIESEAGSSQKIINSQKEVKQETQINQKQPYSQKRIEQKTKARQVKHIMKMQEQKKQKWEEQMKEKWEKNKQQDKQIKQFNDEEVKLMLKQYKTIYIGPFVKGVKSGENGIQYTKYGTYKGQWSNGAKTGRGVMNYKSGAKYEGQWRNNFLEGQGTYEDEAHNIYEGQFEGGHYDGQGTMKYVNGDQYTGMWLEGRKHGEGVYTYSDGQFYDGMWVKDSAQGQGKAMVNGIYFEGQYLKGMRHGIGQQTDDNGDVTKAIWKNGERIQIISINGETVQTS